jgi:hypothetical protein
MFEFNACCVACCLAVAGCQSTLPVSPDVFQWMLYCLLFVCGRFVGAEPLEAFLQHVAKDLALKVQDLTVRPVSLALPCALGIIASGSADALGLKPSYCERP